ncbi:MAG: glycosyltransferase, partial [Pirellulales bacterium]|nr:glycosyltransferase [Pirellulales bacterium]
LNESHTALSPDLLQRGIREPYFVYCGGVITRKRAAWAIQTFEQAASGDAQLVLCGIEKAELGKLQYKNLPTKKLIIPGFIPEEEMPCLFQRSLGVLYPTLYEGFGLPAIESQASGVACLMSPVSSLKELIGPGAISLPTMNKQAWIQAVNQLYRNNGLPPSDAQAARSWTERYCWKGSVNQYEELFYEIVERHHSSEKTS